MADEETKITQPDPDTGDILGAMRAEQANLTAIYQLQQIQNQSLASLEALTQFANDQLKRQTNLLNDIYQYLLRQGRGEKQQLGANSITGARADSVNGINAKTLAEANAAAFSQGMSPYLHTLQDVMSDTQRSHDAFENFVNATADTFREDVERLWEQMSREHPEGVPQEEFNARVRAMAETPMNQIDDVSRISAILNEALTSTPGSGAGAISTAGHVIGAGAGEAVSSLTGDALGAALTPVIGPLGPVIGEIGGEIIAKKAEQTIIAAFDNLAELWAELEGSNRKTRDELIKAGFDKVRKDVRDMGVYAVDIYDSSVQAIYNTWDKNVGQITATMGYTKEAINTLQDAVAQRLQEQGYAQAINAADYLDELGRVLSANLNGTLAEAFAAQNLILEKAVPEIDLSSMASQFAAIYTNAQQQGMDAESTMIEAMNQVAGAVKAIEKTTDGNNQFIQQVPAYLQQAQEIVARAGGSVDNVAALTTEMMSAEGPLASLAPQLSGFTGELVNILTNQNDATAVALRAIMHDINTDIGVSATDFMNSFMEDTKGTLVTAFDALDQFIERNENPAARQEFLQAMESLFGIQSEKLAQLDFGYLGDQLAQTNASLNTAALLDAEALVQDGETATLEEQLVNNTSNMLLAQNAVRDTLDNALMRKLEQNELQLERIVYEQAAIQSVNLAEDTMGFFTKTKDILVDLFDPLGLFKAASSAISSEMSETMNEANYALVSHMSSIGSDVANSVAGAANTMSNTVGGATAILAAAEATDGNSAAMQAAAEIAGVAGTTQAMLVQHSQDLLDNQSKAAESALQAQYETNVGNYQNTAEEQQRKQQQQQQEAEQERLRQEAEEKNQAKAIEDQLRTQENHDNIASIEGQLPEIGNSITDFEDTYSSRTDDLEDAILTGMQQFTEAYTSQNHTLEDRVASLEENGIQTVVDAIRDNKPNVTKLEDINEGVDRIITLFSTYLEFLDQSLRDTSGQGLQMSYSDRAQIMGRGLITS